ncbi:MAG: hypothetical protein SFT90_03890 [Rickettsiales bacterium]|nr:hypothetical protein [Rickettsiales bacterium]
MSKEVNTIDITGLDFGNTLSYEILREFLSGLIIFDGDVDKAKKLCLCRFYRDFKKSDNSFLCKVIKSEFKNEIWLKFASEVAYLKLFEFLGQDFKNNISDHLSEIDTYETITVSYIEGNKRATAKKVNTVFLFVYYLLLLKREENQVFSSLDKMASTREKSLSKNLIIHLMINLQNPFFEDSYCYKRKEDIENALKTYKKYTHIIYALIHSEFSKHSNLPDNYGLYLYNFVESCRKDLIEIPKSKNSSVTLYDETELPIIVNNNYNFQKILFESDNSEKLFIKSKDFLNILNSYINK